MCAMISSTVALLALTGGVRALVLDNNVGKLPALGWNSWNAYSCDVDEDKIMQAANYVVDLGLKDAGYEYINIDDCWSIKTGRDNDTHQIIPDTSKFPQGIKGVADKIHALGLKLGVYSSAGTTTCAGYPASIGYESVDAAAFAAWGVDYLKYDNCAVPTNWTDQYVACVPDSSDGSQFPNGTCPDSTVPADYDWSTSNTAERFRIMRDALLDQNRTILYSLCEWGQADVEVWGNATGTSWRMSGDITPDWARVAEILNENSFRLNSVDFWGHNDPDMLEVGNGNLTDAEARSHFALWAAMKSPLIIGTDLAKLSSDLVDVIKNPYLLAFSQDNVYGAPATPYKWGVNPDWAFNATNPAEFWSGQSSNGTLVLMLNTLDHDVEKEAVWSEIPGLDAGAEYKAIDVWSGKDMGNVKDCIKATVASHDTAIYLLQ
ncbi:MAG: hypothetical protein M4579_004642 [Chaenotheca gracillima]|nr:MAG: hypothetical protein M4579_004642 [Chaenotheca gracillima]